MPRHFDDWLSAYVALFDPITETPSKLHFWTGVSTIAGALTRRVYIDEVTFCYYPNFCIIFVAPPGIVSKSTTLSHGMNLLREVPGVHFAADTTTYPAFVRALADANDMLLQTDDIDVMQIEWAGQCAMTAAVSELGTFLKIEDEDAVNGFTDLLDCRDIAIKDTKNNGRDEIERPFVNILGATTPSWVQDKLKAQIGGWGLSSRIIFIYAEAKKQYLWSPAEAIVNKTAFDNSKRLLISDLRQIGMLAGSFQLTTAAADLCRQWYNDQQVKSESYLKSAEYDNWTGYFLARKPVHMRKLSMVLSAARRSNLRIEHDDVVDAIRYVEDVEDNIMLVFKPKPTTTSTALNEMAILDRVSREMGNVGGRERWSTVLTRITRFVDSSSAQRIIDNAVRRGMFVAEVQGGVAWLSLTTSSILS